MAGRKRMTGGQQRNPGLEKRNERVVNGWRERIKDVLREKKMSQRQLSSAAGLGTTTVRHMLVKSETITLESAQRVASAIGMPVEWLVTGSTGTVESEGLLPGHRIKLLGVAKPEDSVKEPAGGENGIVAIPMARMPEHLHAFVQSDNSMEQALSNEPMRPEIELPRGSIVVWSKDVTPRPGSLVVVHEPGIDKPQRICVRRLVLTDLGDYQIVANNPDYGRVGIALKEILGTVVLIQRTMQT